MGMDTYFVSIIPAQEEFDKMVKIRDLCARAKTACPSEVEDFFNNNEYRTIKIDSDIGMSINMQGYTEEWRREHGGDTGIEIKLSDLPSHIKYIRFHIG
jgi:hypothetical protein